MSLSMILERGADPQAITPLLGGRFKRVPAFVWLEPPEPNGTLTVLDVLAAETAEDHGRRVRAWAEDAYAAWAPHHDAVRRWVQHALDESG
jgi:hypothetical protein